MSIFCVFIHGEKNPNKQKPTTMKNPDMQVNRTVLLFLIATSSHHFSVRWKVYFEQHHGVPWQSLQEVILWDLEIPLYWNAVAAAAVLGCHNCSNSLFRHWMLKILSCVYRYLYIHRHIWINRAIWYRHAHVLYDFKHCFAKYQLL